MSSYDGGGFEEWLRDSVLLYPIPEETWKKLLAVLEPHRESIDRWCDDFDTETQSWRDYRNSLWHMLPDEVNDKVVAIIGDAHRFELARRGKFDPRAAEWHHGPVPDVEAVPWDHVLLVWSDNYIGLIGPWGDALNPLRWGDSGGFPLWGAGKPTGWWTVVKQGSEPRPANIKTWAETFPPQEAVV